MVISNTEQFVRETTSINIIVTTEIKLKPMLKRPSNKYSDVRRFSAPARYLTEECLNNLQHNNKLCHRNKITHCGE